MKLSKRKALSLLKKNREKYDNVSIAWKWDWQIKNEAAIALIPLTEEPPVGTDLLFYVETDADFVKKIEKKTGVKSYDQLLVNIGNEGLTALLFIIEDVYDLYTEDDLSNI